MIPPTASDSNTRLQHPVGRPKIFAHHGDRQWVAGTLMTTAWNCWELG